jgi:hypothetical protein
LIDENQHAKKGGERHRLCIGITGDKIITDGRESEAAVRGGD